MIDFDDYIRQGEPQKREKGYAWQTAIGLQAVDGLKPSDYLIETARKDIEGEITIDEAERLIRSYYQSKESHTPEDAEKYEADTASTNIRRLLTERSFAFTLVGLTSIHRRIFDGVFKFAGQIRDYNITKKEWVLRGDTVLYVSAPDIRKAIEYDLEQERQFDYSKVDRNGLVNHIAQFVSRLWQIHPFGEGNTRTTAVFTILYLRSMGFNVANDLFANHSWYFRNSLVRANYQNLKKGIMRNSEYLERFFRNLLLGETNDLRNRYMVVSAPAELVAEQAQHEDRTTTEQPTEQVRTLLVALSNEQLSLKDLMKNIGLKHRPTFLENYINPAFQEGFIKILYPDKPNHPKQKYLLTAKGLVLYNEIERNR
ncbi:MAG: Fic family protein [Prevotellaceae bacterium]|jgi:fido (protein-threonine AMPylation protein)/predicted transcriptional regulator|nr:Fic family protein [Prevotellaceae bacterium]